MFPDTPTQDLVLAILKGGSFEEAVNILLEPTIGIYMYVVHVMIEVGSSA